MSLASVYPADVHCRHSSLRGSHSVSSSLDDLRNCSQTAAHTVAAAAAAASNLCEHVLTIEELRLQLNSCFTCGVSWADMHVSLDCSECGGYPLERPCPLCDGACNQIWKRDLTTSHACGKARWVGECGLRSTTSINTIAPSTLIRPQSGASICTPTSTSQSATVALAQELCARLEKLQATS
ncbi:protein pinocchio [Chrysoperla carnea]|uniref:protein pinocchio n=1 Tax=Chrysoperla carnea TaxID=189513 RepID=UPI001D096FDD|nr:protein pinocchio [Chrysoperla carnea]